MHVAILFKHVSRGGEAHQADFDKLDRAGKLHVVLRDDLLELGVREA